MNYSQELVGKNIRALRKEKGIKIAEFANIIGISPSYLGLVERGERSLSIENLCKISEAFKMTVDDLLTKTDETIVMSDYDLFLENSSRAPKNKSVVREQFDAYISTMSDEDMTVLLDIEKALRNKRNK